MNNTLGTGVKKSLAFLLIISIVTSVTYLIVYKASFLPNGYDIVAIQKDSISLKSFNVVGVETDIITLSFSEKDNWEIVALIYEVNRQKEFLWMLYIVVTISILLLVFKLRNGMKLWKAILESNIIIAALPLYVIITSLNRIRDLIS